LGIKYKTRLKARATAVEYTEYKERGDGGAAAITIKMDGEFSVPVYENGIAKVYSPGKRAMIRWDIEATREMENTLVDKGYSGAILYAELYGTDNGHPLKFNKVVRLLFNEDTDKELKLGIFDIESLDGKTVDEKDYWKRYELIHSIFQGNKYCHPVVARRVGGIELFEKYVNSEGFEGLVVRMDHRVLKVKNLFTFDAVIYAVEKAGQRMKMNPPRFGSVRIGLLLPNDEMIDLGKVGNGWEDEERIDLHKKLMDDTFDEDGKMFYVKPKHIIEVGYTEMMAAKKVTNFGKIQADGTFDPRSDKKSESYGPRFPKRIPYVAPDGKRGDYPMISEHPKGVNPTDIGVGQIPELADLYGMVTDNAIGNLNPKAESELREQPIRTDETARDVKKDTDVLKDLDVVREKITDIYEFVGIGVGSAMSQLKNDTGMTEEEIKRQLDGHMEVGNIGYDSRDKRWYRKTIVPKPVPESALPTEIIEEPEPDVAAEGRPTYAAILVRNVGRADAEAAQKRRVSYWKKVLPYMLTETMGYPLALVNFSKNSGPMPLVRNLRGQPITIDSHSEIDQFMTRTGKFEKAGTKAFSKGLVTLFYVPSVTGKNLKILTMDFDIKDIDERIVRPFVKEGAKRLIDRGFEVKPFFTGSSWHLTFRKKDCSPIGDYGGINDPDGVVNRILIPTADEIKLDIRNAAAHIEGKVTLDYSVNKANGPIRFPLSLHKKGFVMIPVDIDRLDTFNIMESYPDNVIRDLDRHKMTISEIYECLH
jgi:hypothetical protein